MFSDINRRSLSTNVINLHGIAVATALAFMTWVHEYSSDGIQHPTSHNPYDTITLG